MMRTLLLVALGGATGSALRYLIWIYTPRTESGFPMATFAVNVIGCLIIGILTAFLFRSPNETLRLLLATGFCGGFTTFSAFGVESVQLILNGKTAVAIAYIAASLVVGLIAVAAGLFLVDNTVLKA